MPISPTYPGVYVEEVASGVRTIVGVSTSDTAFIDCFPRGLLDKAVRVTSFDDFERKFGGLHRDSEASYAIRQFYLNGGQIAWVVRVTGGGGDTAAMPLTGGSPDQDTLKIKAANEGLWGNSLQVAVDYQTRESDQFNLVVREIALVRGKKVVVNSEIHRNLSMDLGKSNSAVGVVNERSQLIHVENVGLGDRPLPQAMDVSVTTPRAIADTEDSHFVSLKDGKDGAAPGATDLTKGLKALDQIAPAVFNILCIPRAASLEDLAMQSVVTEATNFCRDHRGFLIVDTPSAQDTVDKIQTWLGARDGLRSSYSAVYFPRLTIPDPLNELRQREVGASGTLAGIFARTDAERGVWKAPAGTEAALRGAHPLVKVNDLENGFLNQIGINVLRTFPIFGDVNWGARTLDGADVEASEWKYIPIRRLALYIEETLFQGLKWAVFEPNDEPLWAQIRLNVGAFMQGLFRQGAFQGRSAREAYFVRCDAETTTQNDRDRGIVNILVGFAPIKPAEFVILRIQQMAGEIQT